MGIFKFGTAKKIGDRKLNKLYRLKLLCAGNTPGVKGNVNHEIEKGKTVENDKAHKKSKDSEIEGESVGTAKRNRNKNRNKLLGLDLLCAGKTIEEEDKVNHGKIYFDSEFEEQNETSENEYNENENDRAILFDSDDEEQHLNHDDYCDNEMEEEAVENLKCIPEFDDDVEDAHENLHLRITETLYSSGYEEYLDSDLGGNMKKAAIKTSMRRIAQFLIHTYNEHKGSMLKVELKPVMAWSVKVFAEEYLLLSSYVKFLETIKELKPNTVLTYLDGLDSFSKWICYYSIYSKKIFRKQRSNLDGFQSLIKRHRIAQKKAVKKEKSSDSCTSMASQVQNFRLPKDGFEGLQKIVSDCFNWASELTNVPSKFEIDSTLYNEYVGFLVAALYVLAPQGRIGGIQGLEFQAYDDFIKMGHAMSSTFKTKAKYALQPVLSNEKINELITAYVTNFRPIAVQNARNATPRGKPIRIPGEFWLTFDGKHDERLGRRLTQFFMKKGHFHVTTTVIRSLLETTAHKAMESGGISPQQREAISNVGGHSSQIVNDYYLKHDRNSDAHHAKHAFNIMARTASAEDEQKELFPDHDECEEPDVGSQHPDYLTKNSKAAWTDKEIEYTGTWLLQKMKTNPNKQQPVFKELHAHILQDPEVRKIFHRYHICSPTRLQHGKKAYESRYGRFTQLLRGDPDYSPGMLSCDV